MGKKANPIVIQQRVTELLSMRLAGAQWHDVIQHAEEENWNVSERQLCRYINKVDKLLAVKMEDTREKIFNRHLACRRTVYAKAMQAGDLQAALKALDSEAKMLGLNPEERRDGDVAVQINVGIELTVEQRRTELLGIIDSIRERGRVGTHPGVIDGASSNGHSNGHANGHAPAILPNGTGGGHVGDGVEDSTTPGRPRRRTRRSSNGNGQADHGDDATPAR